MSTTLMIFCEKQKITDQISCSLKGKGKSDAGHHAYKVVGS